MLVNTRLAADAVGATKMDRPEWGAVNPTNGEVYLTLTNNNARSRPLAVDRRRQPALLQRSDDHGHRAARQSQRPHHPLGRGRRRRRRPPSFNWDIYLFGARVHAPMPPTSTSPGSPPTTTSPAPTACGSAAAGLLWIQTDDGAYTDVTNCMMLAAAARARVGDGGRKTITNVDGAATKAVKTFVGAPPGDAKPAPLPRRPEGLRDHRHRGDARRQGAVRQHPASGRGHGAPTSRPGNFDSHWPDGGTARPRSATIVITRNDGGEVGGGLA